MKRFSIVNNGYNIEEVNNFIDIVIKKLEKLSQDNSNYLVQLEQLKKENNQGMELKISKAILAAQETSDKMKELKLRSKIVAQVHDELILDVVSDELEIVKTLLKDTMENAVKLSVKMLVDVEYGTTWDLKQKRGEMYARIT